MPAFWVDDQLPVNPKFAALIERQTPVAYEAMSLWLLAGAHSQAKLSDGRVSDGDVVRLLLSKAKATRAAGLLVQVGLWHAPGHDCVDCPAIDAGYAFHDWFQMRYDHGEQVKVKRAVRRELKDPKIREAVRLRDGDECRYCGRRVNWKDRRSDAGGTYDHVIPGLAKGPGNIVVCCAKCNRKKAQRRPEQAGMTLRPPAVTQPRSSQESSPGPSSDGEVSSPGAVHTRARVGATPNGQGKGQGKYVGSGQGREPGPAGEVPDTPGRFGSPYHGWHGPPDPDPEVSTCPTHGLDLPCRKCRDETFQDDGDG